MTVSPITYRLLFCTVFFTSCLRHWLHYLSFTLARTPFLLPGCTKILLCKPKDVFIICVTLEHKMMVKRCESCLLKVFQVQTYTHEYFETAVCTAKLQYCLIWTISACSCSLYVVKMKDLNYWQSTFSRFRGDVGNKPCQAFYDYIYIF